MAKVHGKNGYFRLDNSSGTITDLSTYVDSVELPRDASLAEVSAFGDGGVKTVPGLENSKITVSGPWDATLDTHMNAIFQHANTQTFEWGPAGSTAGLKKYTGEMRVSTFNAPSGVGDAVRWTAELQVDGQVTSTTF